MKPIASLRIEILSKEETDAMLRKAGWTRELATVVLEAIKKAEAK